MNWTATAWTGTIEYLGVGRIDATVRAPASNGLWWWEVTFRADSGVTEIQSDYAHTAYGAKRAASVAAKMMIRGELHTEKV